MKKKQIIELWNNGELRKKHKIRMNYKNWVEIYNSRYKIIGGVLYKNNGEKVIFEVIDEEMKESSFEKIAIRQGV